MLASQPRAARALVSDGGGCACVLVGFHMACLAFVVSLSPLKAATYSNTAFLDQFDA